MPIKGYKQKLEYNKKWISKNSEKYKETRRKWRARLDVKEKERLRKQKYRQTFDYLYSSLKSRKKNDILFSKKEFIDWINKQEQKCHYCGIPKDIFLQKPEFQRNRNRYTKRFDIDRKDNSKGYELDNMVFSCSLCNRLKNDFFTEKEFKEIALKYIKPKWRY